ncbi:MAG: S8 family serine peptidase, partial [Candidatus Bathyarchaeota archaeon]
LQTPLSFARPKKTDTNVRRAEYDIEIIREEFAEPLEISSNTDSLEQRTPFWVDLVDAEDLDYDEEGIYVAILDTGLLSMWPWLFSEANIAWELGKGFTHDVTWNLITEDFDWGPLRDDRGFITTPWGSGHGSHVTSTIVGFNYADLYWIKGVAPRATIIPVLVLDYWWLNCPDPDYPGCYDGKVLFRGGTDEMVAAGIIYVADLDLDGPVIISMSLGGPSPSPMVEEAIDYAITKGVIVVVAAGNSAYDGMDWPGAYPQVISCAAGGWTLNWVGTGGNWWRSDVPEDLKEDDVYGNNWQLYLEDFSSRPNIKMGQKAWQLDVTAPGAAIVGPYQRYVSWNGTHWLI